MHNWSVSEKGDSGDRKMLTMSGIIAAKQHVLGTVYGLTHISSLHPHSHLKIEVILSALFADWRSEA